MIAIVDYGVGNLYSLYASFRAIGADTRVTRSEAEMRQADGIVLPGVGAFADAARKLRESGLDRALCAMAKDGKKLLGVCLGMQLLFEKSLEYGEHPGLGLLPGTVVPLSDSVPAEYKIPQIGWNALHLTKPDCPLFRYTREGDCVYFVHSYHASASECITAAVEYGAEISAAAADGNVMGCQFHPEKSGKVGLAILRAFCEAEGGGV